MHWYYTEGELTVKIDGEEHKFSLEELIRGSSEYRERRKKSQMVFVSLFFLILGLQLYGGGVPSEQNMYFYIGYFATPFFISGLFSFFYFLFLKFRKKEVSQLDSMFQEHIS